MVRLVYDWKDGWAPLAHFLQLPVPDEKFPHEETWLNVALASCLGNMCRSLLAKPCLSGCSTGC